jgi:SAM-dependent methyltransferase
MSRIDHSDLVTKQFGPRAAAYVASSVHAQGRDLEDLASIAGLPPNGRALDIGCGGGHASYALASRVQEVVAYDMSAEMLTAVAEEAKRRGLASVRTALGPAEELPFDDGHFDLAATRFSAHHWRDVPRALAEARRVLKPHGRLVAIDVVAPESPLLDSFLQTIEMLRDPSHVRDYCISEWSQMLREAGFVPEEPKVHRLAIEFGAWIARMQTPPVYVEAIRKLQQEASSDVIEHFAIAADGSFALDAMFVTARPRR